jgi:capsular polysaccharide biosynthesis protein
MSEPSWRVDELEHEPQEAAPSSPALVTLHFLLTALRRRWRLWVGLGTVGMLMGVSWVLVSPPKSVGTVTLYLAHAASADPEQAMSTDVSLLRTRTLAAEVVDRLGLDMKPDDFQQSVVSVPETTDVLVLEVTGPDDSTAVRRTRALAHAYLSFRASQLTSQLAALNRGYEKRIASLRAEAADLRKEYDALSTRSNGPGDEARASAIVSQRAQVSSELESIEQSIRDASLETRSVIDASYVLDPAASKPQVSVAKPLLLAMASGLIGATAVGIGLVLTSALLSGRLRLREEVALALGAPVRLSVGRLRPRRVPGRSRKSQDPSAGVNLLQDALDELVARPSRGKKPHPTRLALVCVDNADTGQVVLEGLVERLVADGLALFVLDLSASGGLTTGLAPAAEQEAAGGRRAVVVHRPVRMPALVPPPVGPPPGTAKDLQSGATRDDAFSQADAVLALVEADPAIGLEHLSAWVDDVVVLVTAARSSAERLRTTGELIRSAGLRLRFALMVGSDQFDESLGLPTPDPGWRAGRSS